MSITWPNRRRARQPRRGYAQLASSSFEDWGLHPAKLAEIQTELADHTICLMQDEGPAAAACISESLQHRSVRRRLAAPHLADQVYATLNRWPTRHEWTELAWLAFWYALIIASDLLALNVNTLVSPFYKTAEASVSGFNYISDTRPLDIPTSLVLLYILAWLAMGLGRAGFFVAFFASLSRAWKIGRGVWLARVLQLKLIHTLLVVSALLLMGRTLWESWWHDFSYSIAWPVWLTAPFMLIGGALTALILLGLTRRRAWPAALFILLAAVFLWPGGPQYTKIYQTAQPVLWEHRVDASGQWISVPSTDRAAVRARADFLRSNTRYWSERRGRQIDVEHNVLNQYFESWRPYDLPVLFGLREPPWQRTYADRINLQIVPTVHYQIYKAARDYVSGPQCIGGGGVGWLAVPIPILGVIGLLGMVLVMGRRGLVDALVYAVLCFLAIASTLFPFIFSGLEFSAMVDITRHGLLAAPMPGFEYLLTGPDMADSWLLILGLVLSAGVPWLVTGLFLRPKSSALPPDRQIIAE